MLNPQSTSITNARLNSTDVQRRAPPGAVTKSIHATWATWLIPCPKDMNASSLTQALVSAIAEITSNPMKPVDDKRGVWTAKDAPYARFVHKNRDKEFGKDGNRVVRVDLLTHSFKWLDCLIFKIEKDLINDRLTIHAHCFSTGLFPCTFPASFAFSWLGVLFPFSDGTTTLKEIDLFRVLIAEKLQIDAESIDQVSYRQFC